MEALQNWQQEVLRDALSHFSADDIYNADETGLFWHLLPNKALAFKGECCTSGKMSKERITVLVCANLSGTEKLPLLVIGKSAKPHAFKNKEPPVEYKANTKAWMTADLFETWLKDWDRKLKRQGRKILLYLDNFSGHKHTQLNNITIKFLPPNTTARSEPCDQGITQNLKVNYRRLLLRLRIASIDDKTDYKMDLFKALQFLRRSWTEVKPETVANCFRKAGFVKNAEPVDLKLEKQIDADVQAMGVKGQGEDELNFLWAELAALELVKGTLGEYLTVDNELATSGTLSLSEIAADVSRTDMDEPEAESDIDVMEIDEDPVLLPVTSREANEAVQVLLRYSSNPKILQLCDAADNLLAEERLQRLKQRKITNYFDVNTD